MNNDDPNSEIPTPRVPDPASEAKTEPIPKIDIVEGGTVDGRFLIVRNLSDGDAADIGGIGLVYLAKDLKLLGKQVVIKILQEASLRNDDLIRKFKHEREALARLDHPNIVRILDSGVLSSGNPYMVMEFIQGYSLRRVINQSKSLSFEYCAHIIESVTEALSAAHTYGILHRDVKPENIMLTPREGGPEHVRLIDFGIARVVDSKLAPATQTERGIGTILYIAPEQLLGKLDQSPAADIYACGTVAYEMLTGRMPFDPRSSVEMFVLQREGVKAGPRDLRPAIPEEAESLILQALSFEPSDRPKDARIFGTTLARLLRRNGTFSRTDQYASGSIITKNRFTNLIEPTMPSPDEPTAPSILEGILPVPVAGKAPDSGSRTRAEEKGRQKRQGIVFPVVLGTMILLSALSFLGFVWWNNSENTSGSVASNSNNLAESENTQTPKKSSNELSYYLEVQKMRNGKPFEEPFRASGREIFENGYKFKMALKNSADGFLYLFNEGTSDKGQRAYYLLHPTLPGPESARVNSNQTIETAYNLFRGGKGTEIVWIIWTSQENIILEAAKNSAALDRRGGEVKDQQQVTELGDLLRRYATGESEIRKDPVNQLTTLIATGNLVVHRLELEHK